MPDLSENTIKLILALVVPGFIGMLSYRLLQPNQRLRLKDDWPDALIFGLILFCVAQFLLNPLLPDHLEPQKSSVAFGVYLLLFPVLCAFILNKILHALEKRKWILARAPTAWDHVFRRSKSYWIVVHLNDGRRIGGYFAKQSYASSYPEPGHLYLETLWSLNQNGGFDKKVEQSEGLLLRPSDYQMIELFEDK